MLMFGREPVLPIDWLLEGKLPKTVVKAKAYQKFAQDWQQHMSETYLLANKTSTKQKNTARRGVRSEKKRWNCNAVIKS